MTPKEEVEILMNEMVSFAKKMLRDHGEFHPFGGIVRSDKKIEHVGVQDIDSENPNSSDLVEILVRSFQSRAAPQEWRATAIVMNVSVTLPDSGKKSDAIQINLDHKGDYSAEVFIPYALVGVNEAEYGQIFAQEGDYQIFGLQS